MFLRAKGNSFVPPNVKYRSLLSSSMPIIHGERGEASGCWAHQGGAQHPRIPPNQGQGEKLQLHSYLLNLGIFFLKKDLRRGWREARGRIIRMRDSKFGLCYKKVAQNEHIQGLHKLPTTKLHLSSLWAWGSFSLRSPQEPKGPGLCTPVSPSWKNFGVYLAAIHINLVCKYLTQSFKERAESKRFSENNKLHRFCDFNGEC